MLHFVRGFLVVFGIVHLVVGTTRLRNPMWRTTSWWKDHKILGLAITGPPFLGPHRLLGDPLQPSSERFAGTIQVIVGVGFLIGGLLALFVSL